MSIAPRFRTHCIGPSAPKHTLEFYVDFVCPFSAKQIFGVRDHLLPLLKAKNSNTMIVLRQYPQPWHVSSTITHEAACAVSHLVHTKLGDCVKGQADDPFWKFVFALFENQKEYFDEASQDLSPNQLRQKLGELAAQSASINTQEFWDLVKVGQGNNGNAVGPDMKYHIKSGRQNSIHVTPTVLLDGLVDNSISSSFTQDDWCKYVFEKLMD